MGGNKLKCVDICKTSLNWGVSNRLGVIVMSLVAKIKQTMASNRLGGVIVMSLVAKIKQTMHKLGISLSL